MTQATFLIIIGIMQIFYPVAYMIYKYGISDNMLESYMYETPLEIIMKHSFITVSGIGFFTIGLIYNLAPTF